MRQFFRAIRERMAESLDPDLLAATVAAWAQNLLFAAATFAIYYAIWRLIHAVLDPVLKRLDVDATGRSFFHTVGRVVVLTLGTIAALAQMGVNTASLVASLGIAGLTIGFAARDALSNIISGVFIFWDRPFVLGDLIEVDEKYGRVDRITLRSTRVVTVEGKMLAIPNTEVVNRTVASYTNFPHLRIDVPFTVGVGEDLGRVRRVLLGVLDGDEDYMDTPPAAVVVSEVNDYNVVVVLRAWIYDERQHIRKRFELRERAFEALRTASVEMPFETIRTLTTQIAS